MDFFKKKPQTDEHGNPIHNTHGGHATATAATGHHQGKLHRTGSSSSSSSEDDGAGGRRKKGIKDKIKEKMPGKQNGQARPAAAATTTPVGGAHEKKGFMDKIKDKLPGHHQ